MSLSLNIILYLIYTLIANAMLIIESFVILWALAQLVDKGACYFGFLLHSPFDDCIVFITLYWVSDCIWSSHNVFQY